MKYYYWDEEQVEEYYRENSYTGYQEHSPIRPRVNNGGVLGDCGVDLFSPYAVEIEPHSMVTINTFVCFKFDIGTAGLIWPRGGDKFLVGSGVIDTGYTGPIYVRVYNTSSQRLVINRGDSVGQLVPFIKPYVDGIDLEEVDYGWRHSERAGSGRITTDVPLVI